MGKVLVLGAFGYSNNQLDGQTIKTRNVYNLLVERYEGKVEKVEQLSADAQEDALTNLLNRRGFLPLIEEFMKDENNSGHFCIAFCDIDNFKRINDTYGHDCGDEVLRHITRLIKREMQGCSICRWGGEEIIIFMRDFDLAVAKEKMEYLQQSQQKL